MRLQTIFILLLAVALIFGLIGITVRDFRQNYQTTEEVDTSYETAYSYSSTISGKLASLTSSLSQVGEEKLGWKNILSGLMAIPLAGITAVVMIVESPFYVGNILWGIASKGNIPTDITNLVVPILLTMISGLIIFMLIRFLHRSGGPV